MALQRGALGGAVLLLAALGMVLLVAHRPTVLGESKALALVSGGGTQKTFSQLPTSEVASEARAIALVSGRGTQKTFSQLPASDVASDARALKLASGKGTLKRFSQLSVPQMAAETSALKLAEGHLTRSEKEAIAEGKFDDDARRTRMEQQGGAVGATFADPSGGPGVLKADPANLMLEDAGNSAVHTDAENKALQLAEGKVSASEAASIAAGGTGDDSDRSNDAPAAAVEAKEESDLADLPSANIAPDFASSEDDSAAAVEAKEESDLADLPSANIAPADFASSEGGSASGGRKSHAAQALHRVHKIKLGLRSRKASLLAGEASAIRRAKVQRTDAAKERTALRGADALAKGAQESLDDVAVPAQEVRRGWGGF